LGFSPCADSDSERDMPGIEHWATSQFTLQPLVQLKPQGSQCPLLKDTAIFEEYLVGYATINSDCRGQPFTAPDDTYVAKAIVRVEGTIKVMTRTAKLINDHASLVITDKIMFSHSDADEHVWKPRGRSVAARNYAEAKNGYEY
jgi:hypothetical protein